jgi:hypothetical protein
MELKNISMKKNLSTKNQQAAKDKKFFEGEDFPLAKNNYLIILAGLILLIIGYSLMYGKEDIFSFIKMKVSVIVILGGYMLIIFAIMKRPGKANPKAQSKNQG